MKHLGFGVLVEGKPSGIWPRPLESAIKYAKCQGRQKVEVVPVFTGAAVYPSAPTIPKLEPAPFA